MPEKDITEATVTIGWMGLIAFAGIVTGWILTAIGVGKKWQKLDSSLEHIKKSGDKNEESMSKMHTRMNGFERALGRLEGPNK